MIDEIDNHLKRFVYMDDDARKILSAWVLHTWQFQYGRPVVTPYIYLSGEKGTGKTTVMSVLATLARNAETTASITPSALYRTITEHKSSLLLDESDAVFYGRRNEDLRNTCNSGYKVNGNAIRTSGGAAIKFSTFCPKLFGGIFNNCVPPTIMDRSVPLIITKKPEDVELEYFADFLYEEETEALLDRIEVWSEENAQTIADYRFWQIEGLSPRQSEIAWPLLAIGHATGVDLLESIKRSFAKFNETYVTDSSLAKIAEYFDTTRTAKVHLDVLVDVLGATNTLTGIKKLAGQIEQDYGIEPKNIRIGSTVRRGYSVNQFVDIFAKNGIRLENVAV